MMAPGFVTKMVERLMGTGMSVKGVLTIIESVFGGGVAVGTVEFTYGTTTITAASCSLGKDIRASSKKVLLLLTNNQYTKKINN